MSVNVGDLDAIAVEARRRIGGASDEAALDRQRNFDPAIQRTS